MILKVQRPLASNQPDAAWLVYAQGRRFMTHIPAADIPAHVKTAMGDEPKAFFNAVLSNGEWRLTKRVADPGW